MLPLAVIHKSKKATTDAPKSKKPTTDAPESKKSTNETKKITKDLTTETKTQGGNKAKTKIVEDEIPVPALDLTADDDAGKALDIW